MKNNLPESKSKMVAPVLIALAISILTIATLIIIATRSLDTKDIRASQRMISASLQDLQLRLKNLSLEYGWWDETIKRVIVNKDFEWSDNYIGRYLSDTYYLSASFIVDKDGKTIVGYINGEASNTEAYEYIGRELSSFVRKACFSTENNKGVKFPDKNQPKPLSGIFNFKGYPHAVAVCALTPEYVDSFQFPEKIRPALILARPINDKTLQDISALTQIQNLKLTDFENTAGPFFDLKGVENQHVGRITWAPPSDGRNLLFSILPAVILALIGVGWFTRIFLRKELSERKKTESLLRQAKSDLEERVVERTEQLRKTNENLEAEIRLRSQIEKEILAISEREQRNIGQEIHDGLCQQLTGILCLCGVTENKLRERQIPEASDLMEISVLLKESVEQADNLSRGICPLSLDPESLSFSLQSMIGKIQKIYNIKCEYKLVGEKVIKDNATALHLFRIAQESLNNIVKHAEAKTVKILFEVRDKYLKLKIMDDGKGFSEKDLDKTGMGLKIMKYRTHIIGGAFNIESIPGGGTLVACTIPFDSKIKPDL